MKIIYFSDDIKKIGVFDINSHTLEQESSENTAQMLKYFRKISPNILKYSNLKHFTNDITKLSDYIVFINYFGKFSRNRRSLLPGICESNEMNYVGADIYTNTISIDKHIAKLYCKSFGLNVPKSVIHYKGMSVENVNHLELPILVKPNFEGSSCGITQDNLKNNYQDALIKAESMTLQGFGSIVIEEYINGDEVEVFMFGNEKNIHIVYESRIVFTSKPKSNMTLFDVETKMLHRNYEEIESNLTSLEDIATLKKVFYSFKKAEFIRFDGIIREGNFYLIELSPDCGISPDSNVARAFESNGISFLNGLKLMIINSKFPDQTPNILKNLDQIDNFFQ